MIDGINQTYSYNIFSSIDFIHKFMKPINEKKSLVFFELVEWNEWWMVARLLFQSIFNWLRAQQLVIGLLGGQLTHSFTHQPTLINWNSLFIVWLMGRESCEIELNLLEWKPITFYSAIKRKLVFFYGGSNKSINQSPLSLHSIQINFQFNWFREVVSEMNSIDIITVSISMLRKQT